MEVSLSGNALKTLSRGVTSLARVGSELVVEASPVNLSLHTLNSSRSAYHSLKFNSDFFDSYRIIDDHCQPQSHQHQEIKCSVLLKSICSVLRTPVAAVDRVAIHLPSPDATKLQWTLHCLNGVKKTYWISCNVEPEIQHLSLDRRRFPSSLVVRPRDLSRLLSNFQSSLQEITIIATEPSSAPADVEGEIGGKAVELRSYIDPLKDSNDARLHTQLWIDPSEEFLQYTHTGDPVDVTFGVKELKAFLSFCEGCEVDIHLFFEKAGEPILMAPKFGLDEFSTSDFDATLVLATMLVSQLNEANTLDQTTAAHAPKNQGHRMGSQPQGVGAVASDVPSNHTKIWSELSGSAAKSAEGTRARPHTEENPSSNIMNEIHTVNTINAPNCNAARENAPAIAHTTGRDPADELQDQFERRTNHNNTQHHPSIWVAAGDDDDEDDEGELYVQSTPQYYD